MKPVFPFLLACLLVWPLLLSSAEFQQGETAGNLIGPAENVQRDFNGGFSLDDDLRQASAKELANQARAQGDAARGAVVFAASLHSLSN